MKLFLSSAALMAALIFTGCSSNHNHSHVSSKSSTARVVDAGCGQCLLGLKGKKGCDLAVRFDGRSYFVDGITMKDLGNAHANDGMCNTLRKANVTGHVVNDRFQAETFELLPLAKH